MPSIKRTSLLLSLFFIAAQSPAMAQVLINGGFESGDFIGWEVTTNSQGGCQTDWNVSDVGGASATECQPGLTGIFPLGPVEGAFAAYNSFDGDAGTLFQLSQTFEIPANVVDAQLSWQDTVNIDYSFGATPLISREFLVDLYDDSGDVLLGNISSEEFDLNIVQQERGFTPVSFDITDLLAANAGSEVELRFTNVIPEGFTGPGGFGLDDVSLTINAIPEPSSSGVIALGLIACSLVRRVRTA